MQQHFLASTQGSTADAGAAAGYPPAGCWLPTELSEEVLNALREAGGEFEDPRLQQGTEATGGVFAEFLPEFNAER
jgi:hypothetical protein